MLLHCPCPLGGSRLTNGVQRVSQHNSFVCLQVAQPTTHHAQAIAPPGIFADSPDCLDDLDIDQLVSNHQQQAAKQQPGQHAAPAVHATCSIMRTSQQLPGLKPASQTLSLVVTSSSASRLHAAAAAAAARAPSARPAPADALHASAAPRAPMLLPEAPSRTSAGPALPAARAALSNAAHEAACSHGVPMQQCKHKQDHLNQVNADLVKILLGERAAQPGEQDRLKVLKKTLEECIAKAGPQDFVQHGAAPVDANALEKQRQQSMMPSRDGALHAGTPVALQQP